MMAKPGDVTVTLVAQDLPKVSTHQVYRLWAVAKPGAAAMDCGQFRPDDSAVAPRPARSSRCSC
jgi:hypothetical protein